MVPFCCSGGASPYPHWPLLALEELAILCQTKEVLQKDEAKTKRGLNSYTVAATLSSWLLPFCSSQAAILVATTMTRNCY